MNIRYSKHFLERRGLRAVPEGLAEEVFLHADAHFYDALTDTYVAVKRVPLPPAEKEMALIYTRTGNEATFVRLYAIKCEREAKKE